MYTYTSLQLVTAFLALAAANPDLQPPKLHSTFPEQTVQTGQRVSLRCVASGSPPLDFHWLLDGRLLMRPRQKRCQRPPRLFSSEYSIGSQHLQRYVVSHLNISSVTKRHSGVYTCEAANPLGSVAHSAALNFYVCRYKAMQYRPGAKFYPDEEPCTKCICREGFNGSLVEPFCKKINCNLELVHENQMVNGCVPIHYGEDGCCPDLWRCQAKSDTAVSESSDENGSSNFDSGLHCKFGDVVMNIGDKLSPSNNSSNFECTCKTPPHPVCIIYPKHQTP